MSGTDTFSDELLHTYIDGELDESGQAAIREAMSRDVRLRERIDRLHRTKDMMRMAFAGAEPPARQRPIEARNRWCHHYGVAASLLVLALCFGIGMLGYQAAPLLTGEQTASAVVSRPDRLVLHIGESDPERFGATLAYAERFLNEHTGDAMVEVVTNAGGLDLLRPGMSPYEERVLKLMARYENLHFFACMNSLRNLRRKGVDPVLFQDVNTGQTAVDHIVTRVLEGWTYVRMDPLPEV